MIETAEVIGQFKRKHRNNTVSQIYAVAPAIGFFIQRASRFYITAYIRNMDPQHVMAIRSLFTVHRVIQVLGVRAINSYQMLIAEIHDFRFRMDIPGQVLCFIHHLLAEYVGNLMFCHNDINIQSLIALVSENFRDPAFCIGPASRPLGHFNYHTSSGDSSHFLPHRDFNQHINLFIQRKHVTSVLSHFIGSDYRFVGTFQHIDDTSFCTVSSGLADHGFYFYGISVDCTSGIFRGNINVFIGQYETKIFAVCSVHTFHNSTRSVGQLFLFFHNIPFSLLAYIRYSPI